MAAGRVGVGLSSLQTRNVLLSPYSAKKLMLNLPHTVVVRIQWGGGST